MSLAHTATHPILPHTRAAAADAAVAVPTTLRGEIALALPMRHAGVRTLVLRYELQGPADAPVVFLAGGISAHRHASASTAFPESGWANALVAAGRALDPARHRILAFDYVGADGHLDAPIDTTDQADAIAALLNALDIDQLRAFVGYSYGAMVGLQFAARHPTRLQRLVAVSGAHKPHPYASAWRALQRRAVALGQLQCADAQGLALARQFAMLSYRTPEEFGERFDAVPEIVNGRVRCAASTMPTRRSSWPGAPRWGASCWAPPSSCCGPTARCASTPPGRRAAPSAWAARWASASDCLAISSPPWTSAMRMNS